MSRDRPRAAEAARSSSTSAARWPPSILESNADATLYGAATFTYVIAQSDELPDEFMRKIWNRPIAGLLVTALATLVIANTVNVEGISLMGSAVFLIIFAFTNVANVRLARETGSSRVVSGFAAVLSVASLTALIA